MSTPPKKASNSTPYPTPQPALRSYQREDVDFLKTHDCAACFNEQRTGKTPTAITVAYERNLDRVLIVCPASAIYPWADEYTRWSQQPATAVTGTRKQKEKIINEWTTGGLVISYGSLKNTIRSDGLLTAILQKNPEMVILDEAHRIKDRTSANARAAFAMHKIKYRLALTGTPAPGKPEDVWSILHYLYPKEFRSYWTFISEFFDTVLQMNYKSGKAYTDITGIKPAKKYALQQILASISTQRKRRDVMGWLPNKEYQRIRLPPTPQQTKYLNELKDFYETEHVIVQGTLDRLIRYRQICLHPGLLQLKGSSPKLDWVQDYLNDYPERPTIIFSKFTKFIEILDATLTKTPHRVIVGSTPIAPRNQYINDFQAGKYNLLIINIDAGKEALTLDKAETIIFTDKYPPVGDIEQAEDRFVATTKDKANKGHVIYELMLKGTYDEQLYKLLEKRGSAVDAINNFQKYMKGE